MRRTASVFLASLLGFAALEGAIFHSGLYSHFLNPDSSAGYLETVLDNELRRPKEGPNQILAIGDSRMALTPRIANQANVGYTFASLGVAGSMPRCWYYMLRDVDPSARRYAAIIVTAESYDDAETWEDYNVRESDLHYLVARLRLSDLFEFSRSYHDPQLEWQAFRGILLRGFIYKRDLEDFLLHPVRRIQSVNLSRRDSHNWFYDFVATSDSLKGLTVDWDTKTVVVPPGTSAETKEKLEGRLVKPISPQTGRMREYMRYWLGKIYDRYRSSPTRLVFLRLPRAPWIRPDQAPFDPHSSVRELAAHSNVTLLPEHLFDSLERPELFQDELHLNEPGLEQFSITLAGEMREILGPPR